MDIFITVMLLLVILGSSVVIFLMVWLMYHTWSTDVPAGKLTNFEGTILTICLMGFIGFLTYLIPLVGANIWSTYVL